LVNSLSNRLVESDIIISFIVAQYWLLWLLDR
jgi:hypothetical protein